MTTVTRKSISSQTREEVKVIIEDESNERITSNRNNNETSKASIDINQETISGSRFKQQLTNTTIGGDYVSNTNELNLQED